jgi:hypothetical protein
MDSLNNNYFAQDELEFKLVAMDDKYDIRAHG